MTKETVWKSYAIFDDNGNYDYQLCQQDIDNYKYKQLNPLPSRKQICGIKRKLINDTSPRIAKNRKIQTSSTHTKTHSRPISLLRDT